MGSGLVYSSTLHLHFCNFIVTVIATLPIYTASSMSKKTTSNHRSTVYAIPHDCRPHPPLPTVIDSSDPTASSSTIRRLPPLPPLHRTSPKPSCFDGNDHVNHQKRRIALVPHHHDSGSNGPLRCRATVLVPSILPNPSVLQCTQTPNLVQSQTPIDH